MTTLLNNGINFDNDVIYYIDSLTSQLSDLRDNIYKSLKDSLSAINNIILNSVKEDCIFWNTSSDTYEGCLCQRNGSYKFKDAVLIPAIKSGLTLQAISSVMKNIRIDLSFIDTEYFSKDERIRDNLKTYMKELIDTLIAQGMRISNMSVYIKSFYDKLTPHYRGIHIDNQEHIDIARKLITPLNEEIKAYNDELYARRQTYQNSLPQIGNIKKDDMQYNLIVSLQKIVGVIPTFVSDGSVNFILTNFSGLSTHFFTNLFEFNDKRSFWGQLFFSKQNMNIDSSQQYVERYYNDYVRKIAASGTKMLENGDIIDPDELKISEELVMKRRAMSRH